MIKIKAICDYKDKKLNKCINKDEEYIVDNNRADEIVSKGYATIVEVIKEKAAVKEDSKKNAKKQ